MSRPRVLAVALLAAAAPVAFAQQAAPAKKLYCWTEGGRKVCGDALPASAVDAPRVEIDAKSGMPTASMGRALTPEERAAAAASARIEQQAAEVAAAERRRWMAMVESFDSETELRRAFQNRIELSQGSIKTARMGIDGLRESLLGLLRRASQAELGGKPVPPKLASDIRLQHAQLLKQQQLLGTLERDSAEIHSQLEEAVTRFRESKSAEAGAAAPTG